MEIAVSVALGASAGRGSNTNLLAFPTAFDNGAWSKAAITATANGQTAPDGTTTAEKFEETTANSAHIAQQFVSGYVSGTTYTFSVFLKQAERTWGWIFLPSSAFGVTSSGFFDLATGTIGTLSAGVTATSIPAGNGFYRVSITKTATASANGNTGIGNATGDAVSSYTGTLGSGIIVWGAKLEAAGAPSAYP